MKHGLTRFWAVVLAGLSPLVLALPLAAAGPQVAAAGEANWNNLQRLPLGASILIEQTDGKKLKGGFHSVADDAISVGKAKAVVGVPRERVQRIWVLGETKAGKGAWVGFRIGAGLGVVGGGVACATTEEADEPCAAYIVLGSLVYGGIGAGLGAAFGAAVRERTLVYRAPAPGGGTTPSSALQLAQAADSPAIPLPSHPSAGVSLPAPLREACGVFSTEQAAADVARELAQENRKGGSL